MRKSPKIECSDNYDLFQFIKGNRKIMDFHVKELQIDPSFPENFPTCPIIVNKDYAIIDGQHRFLAAKNLEIPIYYIMDEKASSDDIRLRNCQMVQWKGRDFLDFFKDKNKIYKYIDECIIKYSLHFSFFLNTALRISGSKNKCYMKEFKSGQFFLSKEEIQDMDNFLELYIPAVKLCKKIKGKTANALVTVKYTLAAVDLYLNDKKLFNKFLDKMISSSIQFPHASSYEQAESYITKCINWKHRGNTET